MEKARHARRSFANSSVIAFRIIGVLSLPSPMRSRLNLGQKAPAAALKVADENIGGEDDAGTMALADAAESARASFRADHPKI